MSKHVQSTFLSLTAITFAVLTFGISSAQPAGASALVHCCNERNDCANDESQNCQYGPSCDDVDWQAKCGGDVEIE